MRRTHGLSDKIPEYFVWEAMRQRCFNPKHPKYLRYGGRGITVCLAKIVLDHWTGPW